MSRSKIPKIPTMITDSNQACLAKMAGRGLQEEEVNETTIQFVGVVWDSLKPRVSCHTKNHSRERLGEDMLFRS
jgi:hypothetical protein